jgi:hypothetical protein
MPIIGHRLNFQSGMRHCSIASASIDGYDLSDFPDSHIRSEIDALAAKDVSFVDVTTDGWWKHSGLDEANAARPSWFATDRPAWPVRSTTDEARSHEDIC